MTPKIVVEIGALYNSSYSAQLAVEKMTKKNWAKSVCGYYQLFVYR